MKKIRLGVNIDHVATLRQLRAGLVDYPDIEEAARAVKKGGADQITIHLRGDRRHIQDADVMLVISKNILPINLEMAATEEMAAIAVKNKPYIVCLVPEKREELTTEGGLNVSGNMRAISKVIEKCKAAGIKSSMFIEPDRDQVKSSQMVGADAIEIHTGTFANEKNPHKRAEIVKQIADVCEFGASLNLKIHAGHGLDYTNTTELLNINKLEELNIGHSIVCRSVFVGLEQAVQEMKSVIEGRKL